MYDVLFDCSRWMNVFIFLSSYAFSVFVQKARAWLSVMSYRVAVRFRRRCPAASRPRRYSAPGLQLTSLPVPVTWHKPTKLVPRRHVRSPGQPRCQLLTLFFIADVMLSRVKLSAQLKCNKTVSKQFWNCFVSVSFQLGGQFNDYSIALRLLCCCSPKTTMSWGVQLVHCSTCNRTNSFSISDVNLFWYQRCLCRWMYAKAGFDHLYETQNVVYWVLLTLWAGPQKTGFKLLGSGSLQFWWLPRHKCYSYVIKSNQTS